LAYLPIVQSGGSYDLRPQAESSDEFLTYDTIICSVGAKYHQYNSNIVRTLFIDPDSVKKTNKKPNNLGTKAKLQSPL